MAVDRDLGVAVARALAADGFSEGRGWEMTAATGVRGLRLLVESRLVARLVLTESHPWAFEVLARNVARYQSRGARALLYDARRPLARGAFDYVDLDPYGSPQPFLASALAALSPRGVLGVTATDLRVLAGAERGAAERRYGGRPVRGRLGPEGGLRILLAYLARAALAVGRSVVPLLCYVRGHHVRAYVRLGPAGAPPAPVGLIDPPSWTGPALPNGGPFGPLWLGPLFDPSLVGALAVPATAERPTELGRLIERFRSELDADTPFYYESNSLAREIPLSLPPPVDRLLAALRAAGYAAGRTHARDGAFRTTAPRLEVERLAREIRPAQSQNERVRA